jgi:ATP-dependent helicase/nuclease subunit B
LNLPFAEGLRGVKLVEAENLLDEAKTIAIALREVLETPEKTSALITPDRTLARMVAAQMARFGVNVDDSAGKPLANSAPACFLRLVLEMVASRFAPANLLAVLRHPLTSGGVEAKTCRKLSRELELSQLRGIRRGEGLLELIASAKSEELTNFLRNLQENSAPFSALFAQHYNANFVDLLNAHIKFAEWLSGAEKLWAGEAGNALAEKIAQWNLEGNILPPFDPLVYSAFFENLLAPETYRSQINLHPRLHILSPMEARLQHFDIVIMGGLNEGTWPKNAEGDPWMNRPQRSEFGLPSHERAIGQSAHDVQMLLLSAPEILLTRARKVDGTPTIASRWLTRLTTLIGGRAPQVLAEMNAENYFTNAKNILEKSSDLLALQPPAPCPPISARPRALRVTAIDKWLRDPYIIYAQYILNLRKLEKLDREPDVSDFGNIIHSALEFFTRAHPTILPENAGAEMLAAGENAFAEFADRPAVSCLWLPRFESMVGWLLEQEKLRRANATEIYSEVKAVCKFAVDGKDFSLSTRIDRLEKLVGGNYAIIDYKTGAIPTKKEREQGVANQLPLEALVLAGEGKQISQMQYWKISGNAEKCEITDIEADLEETRARLENLIRKFDSAQQAYSAQTDPSLIRYNDYEHLTRRKEWELV